MRLLLCLAVAGACAFAQTGRIEGAVLNEDGQPLSRAELAINLGGPLRPEGGPFRTVRVASASDGTFVFEGLPPGQHLIWDIQRPGYVPTRYGQRRQGHPGIYIALAEGETVRGIVVEMQEQSVISGRVTNTLGDPVAGATVFAMRRGYQRGVPRMQSVTSAAANDLGEYRIAGLYPGTYYLRVRVLDYTLRTKGTAPKGGADIDLNTYFPNAARERDARPITVSPGEEARGIDIQMRRGPTYNVSGRLMNRDGSPLANVVLLAVPADGPEPFLTDRAAQRPDGSFLLTGLEAGSYVLQALSNTLDIAQPVTVVNRDIEGLEVRPVSGLDVQGSVRVEGGSLQELAQGRRINVMLNWPIMGSTSIGRAMTVGADGTLQAQGVRPGPVMLNVTGLPESTYVQSLKLNGAAVTGPLDLGDHATFEIVLSSQAAAVAGVAKAPVGSMVVLVPATPDFNHTTQGMRLTYIGLDGAFAFKGLAPGEYSVAVFEDADPNVVQHRPFFERFLDRAIQVELAAGEERAVETGFVSAEAYRSEEAKLP